MASGDLVGSFIDAYRPIPDFTKEELSTHVVAAQNGDASARDQSTRAAVPFTAGITWSLAVTYRCRHHFDDLALSGLMGVQEAINRFRTSEGVHFLTYAFYWIRQKAMRELRHVYFNHRSREFNEQYQYLERLLEEHQGEVSPPSPAYLAQQLTAHFQKKITTKNIAYLQRRGRQRVLSLHTSGHHSSLADKLSDASPPASDFASQRELHDALFQEIASLPEREQTIILSYYGLQERQRLDLQQLGGQMSLSKESIRKIREKGIHYLRKSLAQRGYTSLLPD